MPGWLVAPLIVGVIVVVVSCVTYAFEVFIAMFDDPGGE